MAGGMKSPPVEEAGPVSLTVGCDDETVRYGAAFWGALDGLMIFYDDEATLVIRLARRRHLLQAGFIAP
jgi:hypothetical protein